MAAAGRIAIARFRVALDDAEVAVSIEPERSDVRAQGMTTARDLPLEQVYQVRFGAEAPLTARVEQRGADSMLLALGAGPARRFRHLPDGDAILVTETGTRWRLQVVSELEALARAPAQASAADDEIRSELPGAVTEIRVAAGDAVAAGDVLVVMEAMKLIFPLVAARAGTVAAVSCAPGDVVPRGQTLVRLEPAAALA